MTNLICISCPKGCHLTVDEDDDYAVTGNACPRGEVYGKAELKNPVRTVTSTVKLTGAEHPRLPVKTDKPISKKLMFDAMTLLNAISVQAPVKSGTVLAENIFDTGINIIATKTMQ